MFQTCNNLQVLCKLHNTYKSTTFWFNRIVLKMPKSHNTTKERKNRIQSMPSFFFHLLARKPNLEKNYIYSNNFFHNFHLSESSFPCPGLRASELARRLRIKL